MKIKYQFFALVVTALFVACNSTETKTEEKAQEDFPFFIP